MRELFCALCQQKFIYLLEEEVPRLVAICYCFLFCWVLTWFSVNFIFWFPTEKKMISAFFLLLFSLAKLNTLFIVSCHRLYLK